jgi:hypothetical protein
VDVPKAGSKEWRRSMSRARVEGILGHILVISARFGARKPRKNKGEIIVGQFSNSACLFQNCRPCRTVGASQVREISCETDFCAALFSLNFGTNAWQFVVIFGCGDGNGTCSVHFSEGLGGFAKLE